MEVRHGMIPDLAVSGMESGIAMSAEHRVPGHLLCCKSRLISFDTALLLLYTSECCWIVPCSNASVCAGSSVPCSAA